MQAPRNWRNREQRYRLTASKTAEGLKSLVNRPQLPELAEITEEISEELVVNVNAA